MYIVF